MGMPASNAARIKLVGPRRLAGIPATPRAAAKAKVSSPRGRIIPARRSRWRAMRTQTYRTESPSVSWRLRDYARRAVMTRHESLRFRVSWIALLITGLATIVFGLVVMVVRSSDEQYLRAIGAASVGMGLFGAMITVTAFRRRERWAFFSLWNGSGFGSAARQCQRLLQLHAASLLPISLRLVLAQLRSRLSSLVPFQHAAEARRRTAANSIPQGFRRARELQCFLGAPLPHRQEGQVPERQPDPRRVPGLAEQSQCLQRRQPRLARAAGATRGEGKPDQVERQLKTVAQTAPDRDNFFESRDRALPVAGLSIADHQHRESPGDAMLDMRGPEQVEALLEQVC